MICDLVSDAEILTQMRELGVSYPRANALVRSAQKGRLTVRDALYFLTLELADKKRHNPTGAVSQSVAAYGD